MEIRESGKDFGAFSLAKNMALDASFLAVYARGGGGRERF